MKTYSYFFSFCIFSSTLLLSCAKYDFNGNVALDNNIPNAVVSEQLACGTGTLEFDYTINASDEMGILEIENQGSCEIQIEVSRVTPPGETRERLPGGIGNFTVGQHDPPRINAFTIPGAGSGGKLRFRITCGEAEGTAGCRFYYRFSSARNVGNGDPNNASISLNETRTITVPGATTPPGANQCITPAGGEKTIKIITNTSNADLLITYKAFSDCTCNHFIVYGDPSSGRNRNAEDTPPTTPDAGTVGRIYLPRNCTVSIKAKCDAGSRTDDPCDGRVEEYRFTTWSNRSLLRQ